MGQKIVAIIGARLNSSRLPGKQLLPLVGEPVIAHIVKRLRTVEALDEIIVATTAGAVNQRLCDWAHSNRVKVFAWDGDENDVVGRVDAAVRHAGADMFVYVCGDCPLIEPSTIARLIRASAKMSPTGFAKLQPLLDGAAYIHEGFDVFNRGFWERMVEAAEAPFEREHVGAVYFHLNKVEPDALMLVEEDAVFAAVNHRLSVDTAQDYAFIGRLYEDWYRDNAPDSIVDLKWVVKKLLDEPALMAMNAHVRQKTVKETGPKFLILCEAGPELGLGHLTRACVAAESLQARLGAGVQLLIRGEPFDFDDLKLLPHEWVDSFGHLDRDLDGIIVDLKSVDEPLQEKLNMAPAMTLKVGVDVRLADTGFFDLIWMPSIYVDDAFKRHTEGKLWFGPECFLLRNASDQPPQTSNPGGNRGKSLVTLTGGADPARLSRSLPDQMLETLPEYIKIDWIQGPYAEPPVVTRQDRQFDVVQAPSNLADRLNGYDAALCVYGVTFYECLRAGVPTIVFDPIGAATPEEWEALSGLLPAFVASSAEEAIDKLAILLDDPGAAEENAISRVLADGPENFAKAIADAVFAMRGDSHAAA